MGYDRLSAFCFRLSGPCPWFWAVALRPGCDRWLSAFGLPRSAVARRAVAFANFFGCRMDFFLAMVSEHASAETRSESRWKVRGAGRVSSVELCVHSGSVFHLYRRGHGGARREPGLFPSQQPQPKTG